MAQNQWVERKEELSLIQKSTIYEIKYSLILWCFHLNYLFCWETIKFDRAYLLLVESITFHCLTLDFVFMIC